MTDFRDLQAQALIDGTVSMNTFVYDHGYELKEVNGMPKPKKLNAIPDGEFHIGERSDQYVWLFWSDTVDMESCVYDTKEEAIMAWNAFCDNMTVAKAKPVWLADDIQRRARESRDEISRYRSQGVSNGKLLDQALHVLNGVIEDLDYLKSVMKDETPGGLR